jgi:hypothetical protein
MLGRAIVVVSGLPRSGTSLMMQMLAAGGLPVLTDGMRVADADNPRGYFELERVKGLPGDASWLGEAEGKGVKIVSALLADLPPERTYRVLFMRRPIVAILASQREMMVRRGHPAPGAADDARLGELFERHVDATILRLRAFAAARWRFVDYPELMERPLDVARQVAEFLDGAVDFRAMAAVIDPALWRQR